VTRRNYTAAELCILQSNQIIYVYFRQLGPYRMMMMMMMMRLSYNIKKYKSYCSKQLLYAICVYNAAESQ